MQEYDCDEYDPTNVRNTLSFEKLEELRKIYNSHRAYIEVDELTGKVWTFDDDSFMRIFRGQNDLLINKKALLEHNRKIEEEAARKKAKDIQSNLIIWLVVIFVAFILIKDGCGK